MVAPQAMAIATRMICDCPNTARDQGQARRGVIRQGGRQRQDGGFLRAELEHPALQEIGDRVNGQHPRPEHDDHRPLADQRVPRRAQSRGEEGSGQRKLHHQRVQFTDPLVINPFEASGEVTEDQDEVDRNQRIEDDR